jgi:hypothetical protein
MAGTVADRSGIAREGDIRRGSRIRQSASKPGKKCRAGAEWFIRQACAAKTSALLAAIEIHLVWGVAAIGKRGQGEG